MNQYTKDQLDSLLNYALLSKDKLMDVRRTPHLSSDIYYRFRTLHNLDKIGSLTLGQIVTLGVFEEIQEYLFPSSSQNNVKTRLQKHFTKKGKKK